MTPIWKKKPALGIGLGVGLLGAVALALRLRRRDFRSFIPDSITPAIFATRACDTSRGRIVYHISGSGQPLLFLHGLYPGASSYEWSKIYGRFTSGADVIAPDLIGFGESERPANPLDGDEHVESLAEFLRRVTMHKASVVASGLTSQLALLLAARHPDLVSKVFLFLPSAFRHSAQRHLFQLPSHSLTILNRARYHKLTSSTHSVKKWLGRMFEDEAKISTEHIEVIGSCARQYGAAHAITGLHKHRGTFQPTSRMADVIAPVHIVWPAKALAFPETEATSLCRSLPCASLDLLPGSSLLSPLENPDVIAQALERWCASLPIAISA